LNKRYANLLTAEKNLERTNRNLQRLVRVGLRAGIFGSTAATIQAVRGETPLEIAAGGAAAAGATQFLSSPAVQTRVANILRKLSPDDADLITRFVPSLRNIFFAKRQRDTNTENR
ncbi:hypothetical protein CMI37_11500, partial [Candidatus Pacearchaeota archaeon]|nr:hypothetical protein [Candidatus Pacearchaeota archaeon]